MIPPRHPGFDLDLGLGVDVDVTVSEAGDGPTAADERETAMAYLVKFDPSVTQSEAEDILGRLSPPEEGIVLAGQGAVVVRAQRSFVEKTEVADSVAMVHPLRTADWEPNRHRVLRDRG